MNDLISKIDKLLIGEMSVVGGSYIAGTTVNVIGSQQTRAHGDYTQAIEIMQQKEPDNRLSVKFDTLLGAFVPKYDEHGIGLDKSGMEDEDGVTDDGVDDGDHDYTD